MNLQAIQKRWYKESEACIYTGVGRDQLRAARESGKLAYREWKESKRILYAKEDLDEFIRTDTNLYKSVAMLEGELRSKKKKSIHVQMHGKRHIGVNRQC